MKVYSLLVVIAIFAGINTTLKGFNVRNCTQFQHNFEEKTQAFSKDFCKTLAVKYYTNKCCYVKFKQDDKTYFNCHELTLEQFSDIDTTKDNLESTYTEIKNIVCDSSSFLNGSLLLLLFFLF